MLAEADKEHGGMSAKDMSEYWASRGDLNWQGEKPYPSQSTCKRLRRSGVFRLESPVVQPLITPANASERLKFATFHALFYGDYHLPTTDDTLFARKLEQTACVDETYVLFSLSAGKYLVVKTLPEGEEEYGIEEDDGTVRPLPEHERKHIQENFKGFLPKILLITWVTCPHLLNPATFRTEGPKYHDVQNGIICVRYVAIQGTAGLKGTMVNAANYRQMNVEVLEMIRKYKLGIAYDKCISTPLPVELTTVNVNKAKQDKLKEEKVQNTVLTQTETMKARKAVRDAATPEQQLLDKRSQRTKMAALKEALGGQPLNPNLKPRLTEYLDDREDLAWAVDVAKKYLSKPSAEERTRRRTELADLFPGRNIQKHHGLVAKYLMEGEEDVNWAQLQITNEIERPEREATAKRVALEESMTRWIPEMIEAERKLKSKEWTEEQFMDRGERPLMYLQQDSAGGHGLAGATASEEQLQMQKDMAAGGVVMFQQPCHSPETNLNDLGFNRTLQAYVRSNRLQLGKPQKNREKHIESGIWDLVVKAIREYESKKLFTIAVMRTVILHDMVKAEGKAVRETHNGIRNYWNTRCD